MISNIKIIARCIHFFCIPKPFLACTYTCRFVYWKMIHYFICFYSGFFFKYFGIVRIEWGICRVCPKTKCRYLRQVQSGLHQHLHHRCIHQPDVCFYHGGEDTNVWMMQTTSLIQLSLTQITFFKHISFDWCPKLQSY